MFIEKQSIDIHPDLALVCQLQSKGIFNAEAKSKKKKK